MFKRNLKRYLEIYYFFFIENEYVFLFGKVLYP